MNTKDVPEQRRPLTDLNASELESEIARLTAEIWLTEPNDLAKLCAGVVDSGAGARGNYFMTLLFVQSEVRGLGSEACSELLALCDDESFDLDMLRKIAKVLFTGRSGFLNFCGMHEFGSVFGAYLAVIDTIDSRQEFVGLSEVLKVYGVRVHMWTQQCFPWELGAHLTSVSDASASRVLEYTREGPWDVVPYHTT